MKILNVFGRMQRGGAEMRTLDIMRNLDSDEFCLHFCALSGLPGELDETIRALGGEVHHISLRKPDFYHRFKELLRNECYDVVHSHVHYFSGFILMLAAQVGTPGRIAHFRGSNDGQGNSVRRRIQRKVMRGWINRNAIHILAVSEAAMDSAWGENWNSDHRCQVIYNGLDTDLFRGESEYYGVREEFGLPTDSTLYIHVGRFDASKNHQRLLEIFKEISHIDSKAYLLLVGRGENSLEHQARLFVSENALTKRVHFTGVRPDVQRLLKASDLMLFPSRYEGLPGAVLEASAAGIPVLANALPVIEEISPYLPQLHYLSLDVSNTAWARLAKEKCTAGQCADLRRTTVDAFSTSPFTIQAAVAAHQAIWRGESCP